jgi:hypothetical protein
LLVLSLIAGKVSAYALSEVSFVSFPLLIALLILKIITVSADAFLEVCF